MTSGAANERAYPFAAGDGLATVLRAPHLWAGVPDGLQEAIKRCAKRIRLRKGPLHKNEPNELGVVTIEMLANGRRRDELFQQVYSSSNEGRGAVASGLYASIRKSEPAAPSFEKICVERLRPGRSRYPAWYLEVEKFHAWLASVRPPPRVAALVGASFSMLQPEISKQIGDELELYSPEVGPLLRDDTRSRTHVVQTDPVATAKEPAAASLATPPVSVAQVASGTSTVAGSSERLLGGPPGLAADLEQALSARQELAAAAAENDLQTVERLLVRARELEGAVDKTTAQLVTTRPGIKLDPRPTGPRFGRQEVRKWLDHVDREWQAAERRQREALDSRRKSLAGEFERRGLPVPEGIAVATSLEELAAIEAREADVWRSEDAWSDLISRADGRAAQRVDDVSFVKLLRRALATDAHASAAVVLFADRSAKPLRLDLPDLRRIVRVVVERAIEGSPPRPGFWAALLPSFPDVGEVLEEEGLLALIDNGDLDLVGADLESLLSASPHLVGPKVKAWADARAIRRLPADQRLVAAGELALRAPLAGTVPLLDALCAAGRFSEAILVHTLAVRGGIHSAQKTKCAQVALPWVLLEAASTAERHEVLRAVLPAAHWLGETQEGLVVLLYAYATVEPEMAEILSHQFQEAFDQCRHRYPVLVNHWLLEVVAQRIDRKELAGRDAIARAAHAQYVEWKHDLAKKTLFNDWRGPMPLRLQEYFNKRLEQWFADLSRTGNLPSLPDPGDILEAADREVSQQLDRAKSPEGAARVKMLSYLELQISRLRSFSDYASTCADDDGLDAIFARGASTLSSRLAAERQATGPSPLVGQLYLLAERGTT